ncbi:MAG: class I SAM-dependent methyltransferase [Thermodesulfovibrionales bacterium]|nr:class I SAM-dependent methyltransferase [Thermodesulfovibrionales bacterium]
MIIETKMANEDLTYIIELLQKAYALYNENYYEDAGLYFFEVLKLDPSNIHAVSMLTVIFLKLGNISNLDALLYLMNKFIPDFGLSRHLTNLIKGKVVKKGDNPLYKGFLDYDFVKYLYATYSKELYSLPIYSDFDLHNRSVTKHIEVDFLYFIIRHFRPKHVIEFSPYEGLSTAFIYEALKANNQDFTFATFDLEEFEGFTKRMKNYGIDLKVNTGDAIETVPKYLKDKGLIGKVDFCFVDSEHTYTFASKYCKEIFPLLSEKCILMFHDMCYCPLEITEPFDHYGPVKPQEIVGHVISHGEGKYVSEYFSSKKGYEIFLLHKLFGGFGLLSPKLPINETLISDLIRNIEGFYYKRDNKPSNEDRKIPTMMIAVPSV